MGNLLYLWSSIYVVSKKKKKVVSVYTTRVTAVLDWSKSQCINIGPMTLLKWAIYITYQAPITITVYLIYKFQNMLSQTLWNSLRHPDSHCCDYSAGTLSCSQVTSTRLKDGVPVDFIYGYPIFKWVAVTWQGWEGTRIIVTQIATRATCPINDIQTVARWCYQRRCRPVSKLHTHPSPQQAHRHRSNICPDYSLHSLLWQVSAKGSMRSRMLQR